MDSENFKDNILLIILFLIISISISYVLYTTQNNINTSLKDCIIFPIGIILC